MRFLRANKSFAIAIASAAAMVSSAADAEPAPQEASAKTTVQRTTTASSQGNKAKTGATPQTAMAQLKIGSVQDLCRIREREILFHAGALLRQTTAYLNEADIERKTAISIELNATRQMATEAETSWQRLSCFMLLYGSPVLAGGR